MLNLPDRRLRRNYGLAAGLLIALTGCTTTSSPSPTEIAQKLKPPDISTQEFQPTNTPIPLALEKPEKDRQPLPTPTPFPTIVYEATPTIIPSPISTAKPTLLANPSPAPLKLKAEDIPEIATAQARGILPKSTPTSIDNTIVTEKPSATPTIVQPIEQSEVNLSIVWTKEMFIPENKFDSLLFSREIMFDTSVRIFFLNSQRQPTSLFEDQSGLWTFPVEGFIIDALPNYNYPQSPYKQLYLISDVNILYAINSQNGEKVWELPLPKTNSQSHIPFHTINNLILKYTKRNPFAPDFFLTIDKKAGKIVRTVNGIMPSGTEGNTISYNGQGYDAETNILKYDLTKIEPGYISSPYDQFSGRFTSVNIDPKGNLGHVLALYKIEDGSLIWRSQRLEKTGSYSNLQVTQERVYYRFSDNPSNSYLFSQNIKTGQEWKYNTLNSNIEGREIEGIFIVSLTSKGTTLGLDAKTGQKLWETNLLQPKELSASGPFKATGGLSYIDYYSSSGAQGNPQYYPQIVGFDEKTGKHVWTYKGKAESLYKQTSFKNYLAFTENGKLVILDLRNGKSIPNNFSNVKDIYFTKNFLLILSGKPGQKGTLTAVRL